MVHYQAGAPWHPSTNLPDNVTGECPHRHRTPEAAKRCIDQMDRSIKGGHGPNAYCDRVVMVVYDDGTREVHNREES